MSDNKPVYVSVREASKITGFAVNTLNRWRCEDEDKGPPWYKIGRSVRYIVEELYNWLPTKPRGGAPGSAPDAPPVSPNGPNPTSPSPQAAEVGADSDLW